MSNLYTAFLSSNFSSLKDIREKVTSCFLDNNVFPVEMEHFVVDANNGFSNITKLIDDADMFILIMGTTYGSRDKKDINRTSWTEKEYKYAVETNKANMLVVILQELADMVNNNVDEKGDEEIEKLYAFQSAEDTRSQIAFAREVMGKSFMKVAPVDHVYENINQFVQSGFKNKSFVGWSKNVSDAEIEKHIAPGIYYHCHVISAKRKDYLRVGQVEIKRGDGGYKLEFVNGKNYKAKVVEDEDGKPKIVVNTRKYTLWSGSYSLDVASKKIEGIYKAQKCDEETNGDKVIGEGVRDGIHKFEIDYVDDEYGNVLHGRSQDAVTEGKDGKECRVEIFATEEGRNKYVIDFFSDED